MREPVEIALFTDDVEAAKRFYGLLVGASPEAEWPGGAVFGTGAVKLLVHERIEAMEKGPPNEDHFALGTPRLDAAYEELRGRGVAFSSSRATMRGAAPRIYATPTGGSSS
jgi:catechol 2,3-dioxygenase-like lactoylglutathione lyase family enzyme